MPEKSTLIDSIRDKLLDCGLFDSLQAGELLTAAGYFSVSTIARGQTIFNEGDAGTFMCILNSGTVSVHKINADEETVEIAKLRAGRAFGEMAVLDGERRSATCIAASDCLLLVLAKDSLEKMMLESPKVAAKLIRAIAVSLSKRLRMADGKLVNQQV